MGVQAIREAARRRLHAALSVPAKCYADGPEGEATDVQLRAHGRVFPVGSLTGGGFEYAERLEDNPRLVFLASDHQPQRGNVYSVKAGLAYAADTVEPQHGITVAVRGSRLSVNQARAYAPPAEE